MEAVKERPECPEVKKSWHDGTRLCRLNTKVCLLESGDSCEYYEEWLKEEENG